MFTPKLSKNLKRISLLFFLFLATIISIKNLGLARRFFHMIDSIPLGDKIGHFFLMGTLVLLVNLSLKCQRIRIGGMRIQKGLALIAPLVLLEELSQIFVSSRQFSTGDLLADALGLLFFSYLSVKIFQHPVLRTAVT